MTTDISIDKYIDEKYMDKKAIINIECNPSNREEIDEHLDCKITLGNFDMSVDKYIDEEYNIKVYEDESEEDTAITAINCLPKNKDELDNHLDCEFKLGPLFFEVRQKGNMIWVKNDNLSIDKYINETYGSNKSVAGIQCSSDKKFTQIECSIDFNMLVDKYIDTLTDKAVTEINCTPETIDMSQDIQQLDCSITLSDW
jgi:hypothetical protein